MEARSPCEVAFEREQAKEQLTIQLRANAVGKAPPRGKLRTAFMQPVDSVTADEPVGVLIRATADAGTMNVGGIDSNSSATVGGPGRAGSLTGLDR